MRKSGLTTSVSGATLQLFPLIFGKVSLTSGIHAGVNMIHCVADGEITITFPDSPGTTIINLVEGDEFGFPDTATIAITADSGTFHIA